MISKRLTFATVPLVFVLAALTACGDGKKQADACSDSDGALSESAFVFVQSPTSGQRVKSGFQVTGCSNTFEATLNWRLLAKNGKGLASGIAQGGTLGPGPFAFTVNYSVSQRQIGGLEVTGAKGTTEEGFPPPKEVVPLVLQP